LEKKENTATGRGKKNRGVVGQLLPRGAHRGTWEGQSSKGVVLKNVQGEGPAQLISTGLPS